MENLIIFIIVIFLLIWIKRLIIEKKIRRYKKKVFKNYDEVELRLMVGYNYVKNLPKLEVFMNEFLNNEVDCNRIKYIKKSINDIETLLYSSSIIDKTTYYENEFLYKNTIVNMSLILDSFKLIINNRNNKHISTKKQLDRKLKKLEFKSKLILFFKNNKISYYIRIEKIKKKYLELIYNTNPDILIYFIEYSIKKISEV